MTDDENRVAALRAKRERERARWEREASEWTDAELAEHVTDRYVPAVVPPCRVCGGKLTLASQGSGSTWWACNAEFEAGRTLAGEHYAASRWEDRRAGGDEAVVELLRRFQAQRASNDQ